MANAITGGFDAVVQIAVSRINGLLGTLHQNGFTSQTALKLLHNVRLRVNPPRRRLPDLDTLGDWVVTIDAERSGGHHAPVRDLVVATSPPGVATRLASAFADLDLVADPTPPDLIRGNAQVQLSTVTLGIAAGSTSAIEVSATIRALYTPDPGTTPLPALINGTVKAVFLLQTTESGGSTRLTIRPSTQDAQITFTPHAGLSGPDVDRITRVIRDTVRNGLALPPVDLPPGFPFTVFKGVGNDPGAAIALPIQLSNTPPGAGALHPLTFPIVGTRGFGFGVSAEHVVRLLAPTVAVLQEQLAAQKFTFDVPFGGSVNYTLSFSEGPTFQFVVGGVEVSGKIRVVGAGSAPNGSVTFRATVTVIVDAQTEQLSAIRVGSAQANVSTVIGQFFSDADAEAVINTQIDAALPQMSSFINPPFAQAKTSLIAALQSFEPSASAHYIEAQVTPDGVIVRGDITLAPRVGPINSFNQNSERQFDAFESWIPGGVLDQFDWSWVEYPPTVLGSVLGEVRLLSIRNSFLLDIPGNNPIGRVCLRVRGRRFRTDGSLQNVAVGAICKIELPVFTFTAPSWWDPLVVPIWNPEVAVDRPLREAIVGHVSVQEDRAPSDLAHPALIFFPDWDSPAPFEALARGAAQRTRKESAPAVLIVLPDGTFDQTRRELERRLSAFPEVLARRVQIAEDINSGWSKSFDIRTRPALFLMNERRQFAWSASGQIDARELATALDEHGASTRPRAFVPTRAGVRVGDVAPDLYFTDADGHEHALHRLRGRHVILCFWHSSSPASFAELTRLQRLVEARRDAPAVIAFHGSPPADTLDEVRKRYGMSFVLVDDREHRAARAYGVRCWPTTIAIDADARVTGVQLGARLEDDETVY